MWEPIPKFTKERLLILGSWFGVLVGVRFLFAFILENIWIGTLGAVAVTFVVFYLGLKYGPLTKFRAPVNSALAMWYRRKFFYVSGAVSIFLLGGILFLTEYGYANHRDRLISVDITMEEAVDTLRIFSVDAELARNLSDNLDKYSALDIMAITLASADKNFGGYYSKMVSFMFAEDVEITIFLTIFRSRKEIFVTPGLKPAVN
jgi:hypothetical protein